MVSESTGETQSKCHASPCLLDHHVRDGVDHASEEIDSSTDARSSTLHPDPIREDRHCQKENESEGIVSESFPLVRFTRISLPLSILATVESGGSMQPRLNSRSIGWSIGS
jgi:hypothetical protein